MTLRKVLTVGFPVVGEKVGAFEGLFEGVAVVGFAVVGLGVVGLRVDLLKMMVNKVPYCEKIN